MHWNFSTDKLFSYREEFENVLHEVPDDLTKVQLKPALEIYRQTLRLLIVWKKERDKERFIKLCRYLVITLDSDSPKYSYVGVALNKEHVIR